MDFTYITNGIYSRFHEGGIQIGGPVAYGSLGKSLKDGSPLGCALGVNDRAIEIEGWKDGCALGLSSLGKLLMDGSPLSCALWRADDGAVEIKGWKDGCALRLSLGKSLMDGSPLGCALGVNDGAVETLGKSLMDGSPLGCALGVNDIRQDTVRQVKKCTRIFQVFNYAPWKARTLKVVIVPRYVFWSFACAESRCSATGT
jgi:hypothetical protein